MQRGVSIIKARASAFKVKMPKPPLTDDDFAILAEALGDTPGQFEEDQTTLKTKYDSLVLSEVYLRLSYYCLVTIHCKVVKRGVDSIAVYHLLDGSMPQNMDWESVVRLFKFIPELKDLREMWSVQDVENGVEVVSCRLERVKKTLNEWSQVLGIEHGVEEYTDVGLKLLETAKVKKFIQLVVDVQNMNRNSELIPEFEGKLTIDDYKPSILVCSSSGTGKTQLPFALASKVPLLYLLDVQASSETNLLQSVHQPFIDISRAFHECCVKDKEMLATNQKLIDATKSLFANMHRLWLENQQRQESFSTANQKFEPLPASAGEGSFTLAESLKMKNDYLGMHIMGEIRWQDIKLHSVRFLEIVFKRMLDVRRVVTSSWIDCEMVIDIPTLEECKPKSIKGCSESVKDMFEHYGPPPIIFLDECRRGDCTSMFAFKRNLIRMLNLIPVVMGSDPEIRDVIASYTDVYWSRGYGDAWCFVFYDLPNYSESLLKVNCDELRSKLSNDDCLAHVKQRFKLVDMVEKTLVKERPLFAKTVLNELKQKIIDKEATSEEIIQFVSRELFILHLKSKTVTPEFLQAQACFAQKDYQCVDVKERSKIGSIMIHSHLGYLEYPKDKDLEEYKGILTLVVNDRPERLTYVRPSCHFGYFEPFGEFASFKDQPFSHIAFLSSHPKFPRLSLPGDSGGLTRRSTLNLVNEIKRTNNQRDDSHLETLIRCSLVFSMSMNGFKGQSAVEWLPLFASEYSSAYTPFEFVYESEELKTAFASIKLPFIGREDEEWNEDFKDFVEEYCEANIGILKCDYDEDLECRILDLNDRTRTILHLECQNWGKNVSKTDQTRIFSKLMREPCRLDLIVAHKFEDYDAMPAVFHKQEIEENKKKAEKTFDNKNIVVLQVEMMAPPCKRAEKGLKQVKIKILYGKLTADCRFFLLWPIEFFESL